MINKKRETLKTFLNKKLAKAHHEHAKTQKKLQECLEWEKVHHYALLLQSNLFRIKRGMKEVIVEDWEQDGKSLHIQINPFLDPHKQVAKLFQTSKKLQRGIAHTQLHLERINLRIQQIQNQLQTLDTFTTEEQIDQLSKDLISPVRKQEIKITQRIPYREYISKSGIRILVGKGAKDNDLLTFQHANGLDWWLHVKGFPGSHVVIKSQEPDEETIQDALQLALKHSKAKGECEVALTQKKYISRFGQAKPGQVHLSKHKTIFVREDLIRLKKLTSKLY